MKNEALLDTASFNEGPAYVSRMADATARLAGARYKGLALDSVLFYAVSHAITDDVSEKRKWPAHLALAVKGFLGEMRRNRILRDVASGPTLRLLEAFGGGTDQQLWVFTDRSRATVDAQLRRVIGDAPHAELETGEPRSVPARRLGGRILTYMRLFIRCAQPFRSDTFSRNHALAMTALWAGDLAEQTRALIRQSRPSALFIYRDTTTEGSVLVQVAKEQGIPTYSTQHAIFPEMQANHDRVGPDLVFNNTSAAAYVCWGEFARRQMASLPGSRAGSRRLLVHSRPTSPAEQQLVVDKDSTATIRVGEILVSLAGLRQEEENAAILRLAIQLAHRRSLSVSVRPHPSLNRAKYARFVEQLGVQYPATVEVTDSRVDIHPTYTPSVLGLTGMTSMYYENLFFGIPVVFYDHEPDVWKPLPRVIPGVRTLEALNEQVDRVEAMTWQQWYELADPLCELMYNRRCGDFTARESMIDLVRADVLRPQPARTPAATRAGSR